MSSLLLEQLTAIDPYPAESEVPGGAVSSTTALLALERKAGAGDKPQRDLHAVRAIAAILRRFDVVAVQEAKANLRALRAALKALGPEWSLMLTDVTKGDPGNDERIGFLFDTRKISLSGLACELVVPQKQLEEEGEHKKPSE